MQRAKAMCAGERLLALHAQPR